MKKLFFWLMMSVAISMMYVSADMIPWAFVTTWKTDNPWWVANQIIIPIQWAWYNYNIYWSGVDNSYTGELLWRTAATTITFPSTGTYQVQITGAFPQIYINSNANTRQKLLSVDQWWTGVWRSMQNAFYGANNMVINATDTPNLSTVTNMSQMFRAATTLVDNGWAMNTWDVSKVTTMQSMFSSARNFNQPIWDWDVSNVTTMQNMFYQASAFNQDIWDWDVSKVTTMRHMFAAYDPWTDTTFNQDIWDWDVSSVTDMLSMFQHNIAFNQPLNNWNVSNVTTMNCMFCYNIAFNQPLNNWDVSKVTDMQWMFYGMINFNQPLNNWNVSNVIDMSMMFGGDDSESSTKNFNQPLNNWDVSNVTTMEEMFSAAKSFNQNLWWWNVEKVSNMSNMFSWAKLSVVNYDALLSGWNSQSLKTGVNFHGGDSQYCVSDLEHTDLFSGSHGWILQWDGGMNCIRDILLSKITINENQTLVGALSLDRFNNILWLWTHMYTLISGTGDEDNSLFVISGNQLSFISAPDYENPQDQWDGVGNNTYRIRIQGEDGNDGSILEKIFIITVLNISESTGWGGGGYVIPDKVKEVEEVTRVDPTIFNPSISSSTCFSPLNQTTIDQWVKVSEAFKTAHQMLYSYGLTKRERTADYRPYDYLTREEAARFMVEFAENVLCRKKTRTYNNNFSDLDTANPTLMKFIRESYNYGIFNGHTDGTFKPTERITNNELATTMVRLITNSFLEEPQEDRALNYRNTLSYYAKRSLLNDQGRGNIAEAIYDLYRNNEYVLKDMGYVIKS